MRLLTPAKINLHLRVAPVDGSGFHPLMSWFCTVGLFDTLTIQRDSGPNLCLECDDPQLACDRSNLVIRAAATLRQTAHAGATLGAAMSLQKRIPSGGGLGGGSSDAARTLLGLNRLWNLNRSIDELSRLAATLGSDVPFFLHGPSSVCTGRGERVKPVDRPQPRWAVLILPGFAISTPAVYRKFDQMNLGDPSAIESQPDWRQWTQLSAGPLLDRLVNDLEAPAFELCPELAALRRQVEQSIRRPVRMSGSGSSLFTLFDEKPEATQAAARIKGQHDTRTEVVEVVPDLNDDLGQP